MYELLGLSYFHFKVLLFTLILTLIILIVVACQKFGVFNDVEFNIEKLPRSRIIYINHRGNYNDIHYVF
jgi:hypothetical protein